ncbi:MAG: PGF-pre-PGF domain-containing protein [Methanosarcinales archaeon]|nr:PGF-pre-PGF domain-containing protein [Methanosarcinales archaeon]
MKKRIGSIFLMICLLAGLFISPVAGDDDPDELNHYYYSGTGTNIWNIMYTEVDWQDCTSVKLFYSTKYDIGPGDHAHFFWSDDMKSLFSLPSLEYTGNKQDWSRELPVDLTKKIGTKYIGFIYRTYDSEFGEGFCVDNIQMIRTDTYDNIIYDDAENGSDIWVLNFTIESENVSSSTALLEITHPRDIEIEKEVKKNITWTITASPGNENKYWVYKNNTINSTLIQPPTNYQSGEDIQVPIDSTTLGEWDYIIYANDTSGNTISDKVGVKILESIPISINITSHEDNKTVDTSPINVTGWVRTNSTPTVTVNGENATVQGESPLWKYSMLVSLVSGNNVINVTATTSNYTNFYQITVINNDEIQIDNSNNGGGSGGSGGGGGSSGEAFQNIDIKEIQRESVNKNTKVSYSFNSEGNIIRYINFTGLTNSGTVAAKVEILKNTSTLVDTVPPDYIYKNLNIWLGNKGWATSQNMDDPIIEFYVEKSWVTENDIDETTIVMNRYNSGSWEELTTTLTTKDDDKLYFTSNTAGFASFAVTGKQVAADEAGGEGMVEQTPQQTIEETPEHTSTQSQEGIPSFCLILSLIVFFITINYRNK